jgi:hypothetical protein
VNVGRDDGITLARPLGDPVVRLVGPVRHDDPLTNGLSGSRIQAIDTKWMTSPWRSYTRTASSFTGQASASI